MRLLIAKAIDFLLFRGLIGGLFAAFGVGLVNLKVLNLFRTIVKRSCLCKYQSRSWILVLFAQSKIGGLVSTAWCLVCTVALGSTVTQLTD